MFVAGGLWGLVHALAGDGPPLAASPAVVLGTDPLAAAAAAC